MMASSVAADVGFAPIDVELIRVVVGGMAVPPAGAGALEEEEPVVGVEGWCSRRNLVLEPVRKREMYDEKNLSMALK